MKNKYSYLIKRLFDIFMSFSGIIILLPVLIIISVILILSFDGPVLYIQTRIGKNGNEFRLLKFRTMKNNSEMKGTITIEGDERVTSIGKVLRKWKLDELPSLWNVLIGDMSFVGPRPDVSGYADKLSFSHKRILKVRPGITGPATLKYANEEKLLANVDDPIKYNDKVIFPDKIKINLDYIDNWSFFNDIRIIFNTIFRSNY